MRTVIAGGHGQIALRLERLLAGRSHDVAGVIRKPEQAEDLRAAGAEPVILDMESTSAEEVAAVLKGADAVVFAAGGGGDGNRKRKETVDCCLERVDKRLRVECCARSIKSISVA